MNFVQSLIALVTVLICAEVMEAHRFGYSKAEQRIWSRKHKQCSGKHQSPIAISYYRATPIPMPAIEMIGYHNLLPGPIHIHNNGHSVSLTIPKLNDDDLANNERLPYIFGGKLKSEYEIEGLHFHWGDRNNRGSEHVLNEVRYPMEMHIIHRNVKYESVSEALKYADGLTVLAFFYQVTDSEAPEMAHIVKSLFTISDYDTSVFLNGTFSLASILGQVDTERFYTYKGSLTTPPCSEAVTWIIFPDTLHISIPQLSRFRNLSNGIEGSILVDNYRSLQPIGNRRIFVRKVNTKYTPLQVVKNGIHYSKWDWLY